ncbi:MAG: hypothetical protein ACO2O1_06625 [Candidatus Caldarchaeales archaeon]|jgi:hypothetical protein
MILYLDKDWCTTTKDKAVHTLFGISDWVAEDIREYGTQYCCKRLYGGRGVELGLIRCEGMRGARNFVVETYPCLDYYGKNFTLNLDDILGAVIPLVCVRRSVGGKLDRDALVRNYRYMLDVAREVGRTCRGYCVFDEAGRLVVFGGDIYEVVDSWVRLMRSKSITLLSVLV